MNTIWTTFQKEGYHKYPAAATDPNLAGVKFLADIHRHIFHFKVWIEVFHDDRDIEFILYKRWLESLFSADIIEMNFKSCEMLSDELAICIKSQYPGRYVKISISEDNENGSEMEYFTNEC
jgi:hypothetical protein